MPLETTSSSTSTGTAGSTCEDDIRNNSVWKNLSSWISQSGNGDNNNNNNNGYIHSSLELRGGITERGVYAKKSISKGDLLIRLPAQCVLSGEEMPESYQNQNDDKNTTINEKQEHCKIRKASAWMRCLASLYKAQLQYDQHQKETKDLKTNRNNADNTTTNEGINRDHPTKCDKSNNFEFYLGSLPQKYDTLLNWSDEEIASFLTGTALGRTVQMDRQEQVMQTRYRIAIRPYLQQHNLLPQEEGNEQITNEFDTFQRACMCLSTRGFHLEVGNHDYSESASTSISSYCGPFLLPVIDLLNHDVEQKCTTLQRDSKDQSFFMIAERNIEENEEIFHSYGDTLTSAQLLQTFGFVSKKSCIHAQQEGKDTFLRSFLSSLEEDTKANASLTPAILTRDEITKACLSLESSQYASEIRHYMEAKRNNNTFHGMDDDNEEDESWVIPANIEERDVSSLSISDDHHFLISASEPLTDELVTFCSILIMPNEAYDEFMANDPALLDDSVLEDFFLGKMICKALLVASSAKLAEYNFSSIPNKESSQPNNHALYGLAIRGEEAACLQKLRNKVIDISDSLDDLDTADTAQDCKIPHDPKRTKLN